MQPQDTTSLRAVVTELSPLLLPARFEKAQQPQPQGLQLGFRTLEQKLWLELHWQADCPRFHAIPPPPRQGEGSTLAQQLQHGLGGLALVQLEQPPWERVLRLGFAERPGGELRRELVVELMGRHSNLFLLDEQQQVIATGRQVREHQSRLRPIATGDRYSPPPALQGALPSLSETEPQWRARLALLPQPLGQALGQSYRGLSPALRDQLLEDAGLEADLPVQSLNPEEWARLNLAWRSWLESWEKGSFSFGPWRSGYRCWHTNVGGSKPEIETETKPQQQPLELNLALARYYGEAGLRSRCQQRRQRLGQQLSQLIARENRELQHQQELLGNTGGEALLQRQGDLLFCRPDVASSGHKKLRLEDPETGEELDLKLDPQLSLVTQAQKFYKRAQKLRRSVEAIQPRLEHHRQRLQLLENSQLQLELSGDSGAEEEALLEALAEDLLPFQQTKGLSRRRSAPAQHSPQPLELLSPGGLRLLVGRNHRQNDWISFRQARKGDWWFHAQEQPGSHVVLKGSEGVAGDADLAAAAHLAAHFSRSRGNRRVPVVMVPVEQLQRIPGLAAGLVRHGPGEILWGEPDRAIPLLPSLAP